MENSIDILNELRETCPVVANIGNKNVYQIPSGYFETLSNLIINRVKGEENFQTKNDSEETLTFINKTNTQNSFTVPEGYFEGFAEKMMLRIKSGEQTMSASEELATLSPLLNSIDRKMPFATPADYFTELTDNIIAGSKAIEFINEESGDLSPLMHSLKNKNVYQIPAGYFDGLADAVFAGIKRPQQAKVISIHKKKSWLKYAAAAVVIAVIGTGSLFFFHKPAALNSIKDPVQSLAMVSEQEMMNYLENQSTPSVSVDTSNSLASIDINNDTDSDTRDLLSNIPDDELQQYVDDHINSKDLIIN